MLKLITPNRDIYSVSRATSGSSLRVVKKEGRRALRILCTDTMTGVLQGHRIAGEDKEEGYYEGWERLS
jgi:hypothetical protein